MDKSLQRTFLFYLWLTIIGLLIFPSVLSTREERLLQTPSKESLERSCPCLPIAVCQKYQGTNGNPGWSGLIPVCEDLSLVRCCGAPPMKKVSFPGQLIQNTRLDYSPDTSDEPTRQKKETLKYKESLMKKLNETKGLKKQDLTKLKGKPRPRRTIEESSVDEAKSEVAVTTPTTDVKNEVKITLGRDTSTINETESEVAVTTEREVQSANDSKNAGEVTTEREMHSDEVKSEVTSITGGEVHSVTEAKSEVVATTEREIRSTVPASSEGRVLAEGEMKPNKNSEEASIVTAERESHLIKEMKSEIPPTTRLHLVNGGKSEITINTERNTSSSNETNGTVSATLKIEMRLVDEAKNNTVGANAREMHLGNEMKIDDVHTTTRQIPSDSGQSNGALLNGEVTSDHEVLSSTPSFISSNSTIRSSQIEMEANNGSAHNLTSDGNSTVRPEISVSVTNLNSKAIEEVSTKKSEEFSTDLDAIKSSSSSDIGTTMSPSSPNNESPASQGTTEQNVVSTEATNSSLMENSSVNAASPKMELNRTEKSVQATTQEKSVSTSKTFPIDFSKVKKSRYVDVKEEIESQVSVVYATPVSEDEEQTNENQTTLTATSRHIYNETELRKKLDSMIQMNLKNKDGSNNDDDRHHIQHIPLGKRLIIYKKFKPAERKAIKELIYDSLQTANQTAIVSDGLNDTIPNSNTTTNDSVTTLYEATESPNHMAMNSSPEKDSEDSLEAAQSSQVPVYVLNPNAAGSVPMETTEEEQSSKLNLSKNGSGAPFTFASRNSPAVGRIEVTDAPHISVEPTKRPVANRGRTKFKESVMNDYVKEIHSTIPVHKYTEIPPSRTGAVSSGNFGNHQNRNNFKRPIVGSAPLSDDSPIKFDLQNNAQTIQNSRLVTQSVKSKFKKPIPISAFPLTDPSSHVNQQNVPSNAVGAIPSKGESSFEQSNVHPPPSAVDSSIRFDFQSKPPTTPQIKHYLLNNPEANPEDGTAKYEFRTQTESSLKPDSVIFPSQVEHEKKSSQNETKVEKTLYSQSTVKDGTIQLIQNQAAVYQERAQGDSSPAPPIQSESIRGENGDVPLSHAVEDKKHHQSGLKSEGIPQMQADSVKTTNPSRLVYLKKSGPSTDIKENERTDKVSSPSRIRVGTKKQNGLKHNSSTHTLSGVEGVEPVQQSHPKLSNRHRFGLRDPSKHISNSNEQVEGHPSRFGTKRPIQTEPEQGPSTRLPIREQEDVVAPITQSRIESRKKVGFRRDPPTHSPVGDGSDGALHASRVRGEKRDQSTLTHKQNMESSILVTDTDNSAAASSINQNFDDNEGDISFAETNSRGVLAVPLREEVVSYQNSVQAPQQFVSGFVPAQTVQTPASTSPDRIPGPAVQRLPFTVQVSQPVIQTPGPVVQTGRPTFNIQTPASTSPDRIPEPAVQRLGSPVQIQRPIVQASGSALQTAQPAFNVHKNAVKITGPTFNPPGNAGYAVQSPGYTFNAASNAVRIGGGSQSSRPTFNIPGNAVQIPVLASNAPGGVAQSPKPAFNVRGNAAHVSGNKFQIPERLVVNQQYFDARSTSPLQRPLNVDYTNSNNIPQQISTRPSFPPNVNIQDAFNPKVPQSISPATQTLGNIDQRLLQNVPGVGPVYDSIATSNAANDHNGVIAQNSEPTNAQFDYSRAPAKEFLNPGTRFEVQQQPNQKYFPNPGSVFNIPLLQPSVPLTTTTPAPIEAPSSFSVLQRMPGYIMQQFRNLFSSQQENHLQEVGTPVVQELEPVQEQPTRFTIPLVNRPTAFSNQGAQQDIISQQVLGREHTHFGNHRQNEALVNLNNKGQVESTNSQSVLKALQNLKSEAAQTNQHSQSSILQQDRTLADEIRENQLLETLSAQLVGAVEQQNVKNLKPRLGASFLPAGVSSQNDDLNQGNLNSISSSSGPVPKRILIPNSVPVNAIPTSHVGRTNASRRKPIKTSKLQPLETPQTVQSPSLQDGGFLVDAIGENKKIGHLSREHAAQVGKTISPTVSAFEILKSQFAQSEAEFAQLAQQNEKLSSQEGRKKPQSLQNREPTQGLSLQENERPFERIQENQATRDLIKENAVSTETTSNPTLTALEVLKLQSLKKAQLAQQSEAREDGVRQSQLAENLNKVQVAKVEKTTSPSVSAFDILQSQFSQVPQSQENTKPLENDGTTKSDSKIENTQLKKNEGQQEVVKNQEQATATERQLVQKGGRRRFSSRSRLNSDQVSPQKPSFGNVDGNQEPRTNTPGIEGYKKKTHRMKTGGLRKKFMPRPQASAPTTESATQSENSIREEPITAETSSSPVPKRIEIPNSSSVSPFGSAQMMDSREGSNPLELVAEHRDIQASPISKPQTLNQYTEQALIEQMGVSVEPDQVLLINEDSHPPIRSMFNSESVHLQSGKKQTHLSPSAKHIERNQQRLVSKRLGGRVSETSTSTTESSAPDLREVPVFPSRTTQSNARRRIVPSRRRNDGQSETQQSTETSSESTRQASRQNPPRVKKSEVDDINERFVNAMYSLSQFLRS